MQVELTGQFRKSISLNEHSLSRLATVLDEIRGDRFQVVASERGIPVKELEELWRGERLDEPEPTLPKTTSVEEVQRHYETLRKRDETRRLAARLDELANLQISVKYKSGTSYDFSELSQLKAVQEDEPGMIERLMIMHGVLLRDYISISFYDGWATCIYRIAGSKTAVQRAQLLLGKFLRDATPDFPYLHHKVLHGGVAIVIGGLLTTYLTRDWLGNFLGNTKSTVSWQSFLLSTVVSGLTILGVTSLMERSFPKLQMEFGPYWRRMKARRAVMLLVLTVLVVPIVSDLTGITSISSSAHERAPSQRPVPSN